MYYDTSSTNVARSRYPQHLGRVLWRRRGDPLSALQAHAICQATSIQMMAPRSLCNIHPNDSWWGGKGSTLTSQVNGLRIACKLQRYSRTAARHPARPAAPPPPSTLATATARVGPSPAYANQPVLFNGPTALTHQG